MVAGTTKPIPQSAGRFVVWRGCGRASRSRTTTSRRSCTRYQLRTKAEAVDLALRKLAGEPMTREEALAMGGSHSIGEVPPDQPPRGLDE